MAVVDRYRSLPEQSGLESRFSGFSLDEVESGIHIHQDEIIFRIESRGDTQRILVGHRQWPTGIGEEDTHVYSASVVSGVRGRNVPIQVEPVFESNQRGNRRPQILTFADAPTALDVALERLYNKGELH